MMDFLFYQAHRHGEALLDFNLKGDTEREKLLFLDFKI